MAGELGFEPRLTESESVVLPLDDSPGEQVLGASYWELGCILSKCWINLNSIFDKAFTSSSIRRHCVSSMYAISLAISNCVHNSPHDPFAILRNWMQLRTEWRSYPSAIFDGIDNADRVI